MAHVKTSSLGRLGWFAELPSWSKKVVDLRNDIQGKQESADGIAYDGDIQNRFKELDEFINNCASPVSKSMLRKMRIQDALEAKLSDTESLVTIKARQFPDTESPEAKIYNTLKSMREKCETAAHQFLRHSWKYDGKELDEIVRLMEELCHHTTNSDFSLDSMGAHNEKAFLRADGEAAAAEKLPHEDGAGLSSRSSEQGFELITLNRSS
ncbi:hypothetical protein VTI28DRAFT_5485 [Corynascus sepedonium]